MHLPPLFSRPQQPTEPSALVRMIAREDVEWSQWNRPLFKAPPLNVQPPVADVALLAADILRKDAR
jgi:hypothetical protein